MLPVSLPSNEQLFSSLLPTVCLLRALYCLALVVSDLVAFSQLPYHPFSPVVPPFLPCLGGEPELSHLTISCHAEPFHTGENWC